MWSSKVNTSAELNVMADGSVAFVIADDRLTLNGRLGPEAALILARQILEVHEAKEALEARRKEQAK